MNFGQQFQGNQAQQAMTYDTRNQQPIAMNQLLSQQEIDLLRHKEPGFCDKLTKMEALAAFCTHKDPSNGSFTLTEDPDQPGWVTCSICHAHFYLFDIDNYTMQDIEQRCMDFYDVFQSIKTFYGAIPQEGGRDLYLMSGFIKKMPAMFKYAAEYFRKVGGGAGLRQNNIGNNTMQAWQALMTGSMGMGGMNAYPQWGAGMNAAQAQVNQNAFGQATSPLAVNRPIANYNGGGGTAAAGADLVGFVDPTGAKNQAPAAMQTETQRVAAPEVHGGFNG